MNTGFVAFDQPHHLGDIATHPLARLVARLPLHPQGVGRGCKADKSATTTHYPQRVGRIRKAAKALKDSFQYPLEGYSDPLRAEARAESYAATTPLSLLGAGPACRLVASRQTRAQTHHRTRPTAVSRFIRRQLPEIGSLQRKAV